MNGSYDVVPVGDAAVLAVVGDTINEATVRRVWSLAANLRKRLGPSVYDIVPAYGSVMIRFNPLAVQLAAVMATARAALETAKESATQSARTIDVGVFFGDDVALDLQDVAKQVKLSTQAVIEEFCRPHYQVAFLGFTAGFPYLIGLPTSLDLPRLETPRMRVPAGSVAFAAGQCGIYPRSSPGGWRIIGKTNAKIFDPSREHPALFGPGDNVRFVPVASLEDASATING